MPWLVREALELTPSLALPLVLLLVCARRLYEQSVGMGMDEISAMERAIDLSMRDI